MQGVMLQVWSKVCQRCVRQEVYLLDGIRCDCGKAKILVQGWVGHLSVQQRLGHGVRLLEDYCSTLVECKMKHMAVIHCMLTEACNAH